MIEGRLRNWWGCRCSQNLVAFHRLILKLHELYWGARLVIYAKGPEVFWLGRVSLDDEVIFILVSISSLWLLTLGGEGSIFSEEISLWLCENLFKRFTLLFTFREEIRCIRAENSVEAVPRLLTVGVFVLVIGLVRSLVSRKLGFSLPWLTPD